MYLFFPTRITHILNIHSLISPNNTYDVHFNGESHNLGNLLEDFTPPVNPPKEIEDPDDKKPEDWVDTKKIPDPDAKKVRSHFKQSDIPT